MTENQKRIPSNIELKLIDNWPSDEIVELYKTGGWWREGYDPSGIPSLIIGSFAFLVAVDTKTKRAIGMGRVRLRFELGAPNSN